LVLSMERIMQQSSNNRPHLRTFGVDHPIGMLFVCLNAIQQSQCRKLKQLKFFRIFFRTKNN
jgi:hypothetical protein